MLSHKLLNLRLSMVEYAKEHGISEAARAYRTTRKTVRKWVRRYEREGIGHLSRILCKFHSWFISSISKVFLNMRCRVCRWALKTGSGFCQELFWRLSR